jgi:hypothetical protein
MKHASLIAKRQSVILTYNVLQAGLLSFFLHRAAEELLGVMVNHLQMNRIPMTPTKAIAIHKLQTK